MNPKTAQALIEWIKARKIDGLSVCAYTDVTNKPMYLYAGKQFFGYFGQYPHSVFRCCLGLSPFGYDIPFSADDLSSLWPLFDTSAAPLQGQALPARCGKSRK